MRLTIVSFGGSRGDEKAKVTTIEGDFSLAVLNDNEIVILDRQTGEHRAYRWDMIRILADEKLGRL
jgi:hypothetical protein